MKIIDRESKDYIDIDGYDELLPGDLDNETMVSSPKRISTLQNRENLDKENLAIFSHSIKSKLTLKTYGKYCVKKFHKHDGGGPILTVTELPIKTWIHKYRKWLEFLVQQKGKNRLVYDFKDNSTTEKPVFEIHWNAKAKTPNLQNLRLIRSFGLSNITLIDHRGFPTRFENVTEVMEKYYVHMIEHYHDVRNNRIKKEELRVRDLTYKIKFISNVLNGNIVLLKVSEEIIKLKMEQLEIPFDYYDKSKSRDFSKESLDKYKNQITEAQARLKVADETTAQKIWLDKLDTLEVELRKRYRGKSFNMKT
jgi:DNA gyrase/topoisomerase IV subunit A